MTKKFGSGVGTGIVLQKCLCDQLFFATQQDGLFLALCAYHHADKLPYAIEEVKRTFLTTWIADCSLWPVVNFFGFAFVPMKLQPTYMASIQFFWQVYLSSMASAGNEEEDDNAAILETFAGLDGDNSGFIDVSELDKECNRRGLKLNKADVGDIMRTIDVNGDGKISYEEFKTAIKSGSIKSTVLWRLLSDDLEKGAKGAIKRLQNMSVSDADITVRTAMEEAKDKKDRQDALNSASIGGSALLFLAFIRRFFMKI